MDLGPFWRDFQASYHLNWATLTSALVVIAVALIALRLLGIAVRGIARGILLRDKEPAREATQKAKTLSQVVETSGKVVVFTLTILTLLSLLGQDVTPLLASAGIAGVAIGFGAQNLIKDWLSGFFILLEGQYSIDDVIKIGDNSGVVERLELRRTVLRAADGSLINIPNGDVRVVTNLTKEWSRVVIDIGVSYDDDVDRAIELLKKAGDEIAADEELSKMLLDPPEVLGIEAMGEYKVTVRMWVKTLPSKQWLVARALRSRIMRLFKEEGIQTPYPHQVTIAHPSVPQENKKT